MNNRVARLEKYLEEKVEQIVGKLSSKADKSDIEAPEQMLGLLLNAAAKNEWETTLLSSHWVTTEKDMHFAILLARLAGDEAKHFCLIEKYLNKTFQLDDSYTPLYRYLIKIDDTFTRAVAGPFTREYLAIRRNELFLRFCKKYDFNEVIEIYDVIQKEESHHHQLGISILNKLVNSDEDFQRAKDVIDQTLKVVDDLQEMVSIKKGLNYLPGC